MDTFAIPGRGCIESGRLAAYITRPLGTIGLFRLALRAFFRGLYGATELEVVCARELHVSLRPAADSPGDRWRDPHVSAPLMTFRWRERTLRVITGLPAESPTA